MRVSARWRALRTCWCADLWKWAGKVAGPVGRLEQAQQLARSEGLRRRYSRRQAEWYGLLALADCFIAQDVPVILVTGYDVAVLPERFAATPRLPKPFDDGSFDRLAVELFVGGAP